MTKKNLRPQQVAPVQRETTGTSSQQGQMTASLNLNNAFKDVKKAVNEINKAAIKVAPVAKLVGAATPFGKAVAIANQAAKLIR
jgi:prenylated cyclic peptide (anacyclamide/piricyclamide family)